MYMPHKTTFLIISFIFLIFKLTLLFIEFFFGRRNEDNYLDLNNLPVDSTRDGNKQTLEEGSSSGILLPWKTLITSTLYTYM